GEETRQRIFVLARETVGIVGVYQETAKSEIVAEKPAAIPKPNGNAPQLIQNIKPVSVQLPVARPTVQPPVPEIVPEPPKTSPPAPLPLEFSNKVEEKARQTAQLSAQEWQTLLSLMGELLETLDKSLATANLDFAAAFQKARVEIS